MGCTLSSDTKTWDVDDPYVPPSVSHPQCPDRCQEMTGTGVQGPEVSTTRGPSCRYHGYDHSKVHTHAHTCVCTKITMVEERGRSQLSHGLTVHRNDTMGPPLPLS